MITANNLSSSLTVSTVWNASVVFLLVVLCIDIFRQIQLRRAAGTLILSLGRTKRNWFALALACSLSFVALSGPGNILEVNGVLYSLLFASLIVYITLMWFWKVEVRENCICAWRSIPIDKVSSYMWKGRNTSVLRLNIDIRQNPLEWFATYGKLNLHIPQQNKGKVEGFLINKQVRKVGGITTEEE